MGNRNNLKHKTGNWKCTYNEEKLRKWKMIENGENNKTYNSINKRNNEHGQQEHTKNKKKRKGRVTTK